MDDEMLVKFLLEEVTEEEQNLVNEWIARKPENQRYFGHFQLIWQQSRLLARSSTVDEHAAWLRLQKRLHPSPKPGIVVPFNKSYKSWRMAASVILLIGVLSLLYMLIPTRHDALAFESKGSAVTDTLPDQSVVTLNKHSALSYKEEPGTKAYRKATLKGEGFFNIHPDKTKPFIVEVDGITVQVVGTSFNIKSLKDSTEIIVETGIVTVSKNGEVITLIKGDKLVIPRAGSIRAKQRSADHLYNYYRSRQFVCDNTPLWKLVEVLNEAYETNIVIENKKAAGELLTTTFDNEPIEKILAVIAETFNLSIEKRTNKIILK